MFYNEEVKTQFINDYMRSRVVAETSLSGLFNKTAAIEEEKDKDCSEFTQDEILDMYRRFNAKSVHVLENYNVHLKSYVGFCMYKGLCTENNYTNISKHMLTGCISEEIKAQKILTREQLDDIEDELYNYTDKAILECLWHGISGKSMDNLVSLDRSMISADKKYINLKDGSKVKLTKKLYEYLDKAFDEKEYMCYGRTIRVKELVGEDCLYKEMDNAYTADSDDKFFRWVYRRIKTYREYVDLPMLTMKNIQASGLLDAIQRGMKRNDMNLREFLHTEEGESLAAQYGYNLKFYVDVIANKFVGYL